MAFVLSVLSYMDALNTLGFVFMAGKYRGLPSGVQQGVVR
jgi:hypothetical protein